MKRICLISRKFDVESGRAEWIYAGTLKKELSKRGFEVNTISQATGEVSSSKKRKFLHDFFMIPLRILLLRLNGIKTFHFLNENQAIFNWLVWISGGKSITTFHDFMGLNSEGVKKKYFNFVYWIASKSNILICNSEQTKLELKSKFKIKKDIKVIYPIIVERLNLKKEVGGINKIGYLGSFDKRKRVEKIIQVAKHLPKDYVFELWGQGQTKKEIEEQLLKNSLKNFKVMGHAPSKKIGKIYNSFNFFVFPTREEGLGLPIIEAMSYGNPVFILKDAKIPSELRSLCNVCKDPKEIAKKIKEFSSPKKYKKIVSINHKNSKRFSKEENIRRLIKTYNEN